MSFIEKDIMILNNYESAPFKNKNHAIECLIPYHVFQVMADDVKFKGSDIDIDLNKEIEGLMAKLERLTEETAFGDEGFTPQLLLYHEQRYLNTLLQQQQVARAVAPAGRRGQKQNRTALCLKISKAKSVYVYGHPSSIRIRMGKDRK